MKTKIKIPKGWRKLRNGEVLKAGDECKYGLIDTWSVTMQVIRRIKPEKKGGK